MSGQHDIVDIALINGTYIWNVWCNSSGGLSSFAESNYTVHVDTVAPGFLGNSTNATSTSPRYGEVVQLNITAFDDSLSGYYITNNASGTMSNGTYKAVAGQNHIIVENITISNLRNSDTFGWQIWINDSAGNVNVSAVYTIEIRNSEPAFTNARNGSTNLSRWYNYSANITITDSDNDLSNYVFSSNATGSWVNHTPVIISGGEYHANSSQNISIGSPNILCWKYYANDTTGAMQSSDTYCFQVQNSLPYAPTVIYPQAGQTYIELGYINYSAYDIDEDTITYSIYINNSLNITTTTNVTDWNATDGFYLMKVSATDGYGWSANSSEINFTLDSVVPSVMMISPQNNSNISSNTIALNLTASEPGLVFYWYVNGSLNSTTADANSTLNASDGYYNLTVFASDGVSNGTSSIWFVLDTKGQSFADNKTNSSLTTPKFGDTLQINLTIRDNFNLKGYYLANNDTGTMQNGTYRQLGRAVMHEVIENITINTLKHNAMLGWQVWAVDHANNTNVSQTYTVQVRNNLPSTPQIIYPVDGDVLMNLSQLNFTATDADYDVIVYYVFVNNSLNMTTTSNISSWNISDGNYNVTVSAYDGYDFSENSSVLRFILDSTMPRIALNAPADNSWLGSSEVVFNFTATNAVMDTCILYHNISGAWSANYTNSSPDAGSVNIIIESVADGSYLWNVRCNNTLGTYAWAENRSFYVDTAGPIIELSYPLNLSIIRTPTVYFNWTVSDNVDPSILCNLTLNNTVMETVPSRNNVTTNVTLGSLAPGYYSWNLTCWDNASHINNSEMRVFTLEELMPVITLVKPADGSRLNASNVSFAVSLESNASWCGLSLDGASNKTMNRRNATYFNYTNTSMSDATHGFVVYCNDSYSNVGESANYTLLIDTIYPSASFIDPTPTSLITTTSATISISYADANNVSMLIDLDNSLAAWFRFDYFGSNLVDHKGLNNGVTHGGVYQTDAGYFGKGFVFDGSDGYATVDNEQNFDFESNENFTIAAWIKLSSNRTGQSIFSKYSAGSEITVFASDETGNLSVRMRGSGGEIYTKGPRLAVGNWSFVAVSYNGSGLASGVAYHLNGRSQRMSASSDSLSGSLLNDEKIELGRSNGGSYLNATLDNLMIFNVSLGAGDIAALTANKSTGALIKTVILDDGLHNITQSTQDLAGNVNFSSTYIEVDVLAPTVVSSYPSGRINTVTFGMTATTNKRSTCRFVPSTQGNITMEYGDMPYDFTGSTTSHNYTLTLAEGYYEYYARCRSLGGNTMNESRNISFTVDIDSTAVSSPGGGGGGGGGFIDTPENKRVLMNMSAATTNSMFIGETINMPVRIKNIGDMNLTDVQIRAVSSSSSIQLTLPSTTIKSLLVGQEASLNLNIQSTLKKTTKAGNNRYVIMVYANAPKQNYQKSLAVIVGVEEKDYELRRMTERQMEFVKDLFNQNPQCLKYESMIKEAEKYYNENNYNMSLQIIDSAIQACRDTIAPKEKEMPIEKPVQKKGSSRIAMIEMIVIIILAMLLLRYTRRRKQGQGKTITAESSFDDMYFEIKMMISKKKIFEARNHYIAFYALYEKMMVSNIPNSVKSECHAKLADIYNRLTKRK